MSEKTKTHRWQQVSFLQKIVAICVALALMVGGFYAESLRTAFAESDSSLASSGGDANFKSVQLGTKGIGGTGTTWTKDAGDYLYYGSYNGTPIKWRVLNNSLSSVLLDADKALWPDIFFDSDDDTTEPYKDSDIRSYLMNGNDLNGNPLFNDKELGQLLSTNLEAKTTYRPSRYTYENSDEFTDDASDNNKAFILSANEIDTYYPTNLDAAKEGAPLDNGNLAGSYWTRTYQKNDMEYNVAAIFCSNDDDRGIFLEWGESMYSSNAGVAPATNLDPSNVLFTTDNSFDKTGDLSEVPATTTKEWKATIKDSSLKVTTEKAKKKGDKITVPYSVEGSDASQVSVVISSGDITNIASQILYYGKLADVSNASAASLASTNSATFTLPSDLAEGSKIYLMAEDVNGESATDFASEPVELTYEEVSAQTLTVRSFNGNGSLKVNGVAASKDYQIDVEEGQTITLTWKPTAVSNSNNINFIKTIKFNDADQGAVSKVNKKNWQELNTEYKRRMKETYQMTTLEKVLGADQTLTLTIGSVEDNYLDIDFQEVAPVYRMYNMITSEHLFTTDKKEYDDWVAIGKKNKDYWLGEGVDWFSPVSYVNDTKTPKVYRLYNPGLGAMTRMSHYYTSSKTEMEDLCKNWGWKKETQFSGKDGCVFLSDDTGSGVPIFTAYSEALRSSHHYTSSSKEWKGLDAGWDKERSKNVKNGKETGFFRATLSAKPE